MTSIRSRVAVLVTAGLAVSACGGDTDAPPAAEAASPGGVTVVAPDVAAATIDDAPSDLVVLDVRTPDEFADGHIDGAIMIDFYRDDFAEQLAQLDPDVPYVLYCRSGNRSGQARQLMEQLGFTDVADVDGGILAWQAAGLPVVGE